MRQETKKKELQVGDVVIEEQGVWMVIQIRNKEYGFGFVNLRNGIVSSSFCRTLSDLEEFAINDIIVDAELIIK